MKKVVLTLVAAVSVLTMNAQTHYDLDINIDTSYEYGSFYYPVIVKDEKYADPYVWVYVDKEQKEFYGLMIYGYKEDINLYCDSIIKEMGDNPLWEVSETKGYVYRKEWEIITEEGFHYLVFLLNYDDIGKLYVHELNSEESKKIIGSSKKYYISLYGKEKVNEWLGK